MSATDGFSWTDERVARLKELWASGLSASVIAKRLVGISRQAVISKVHRLGIQQRHQTVADARASRRTPVPKRQLTPPSRPPMPPIPAPVPIAPPRLAELPPAAACAPITFDALSNSICHWPLNDGGAKDWRFCGAPRHPHSKSYCHHHHARSIDAAYRQRFLARCG